MRKVKYRHVLDTLRNIKQEDNIKHNTISKILGGTPTANALAGRYHSDGYMEPEEVEKIQNKYNYDFYSNNFISMNNNIETVALDYYPDVYLSAGYGVEVYDENKETLLIDSKLLVTERGNKINPEHCEIVRVSGNSMSPEYRHGDRVIIDRGDTELLDGHIFAFRYNGSCFVKEINLLGDKIKCISLNKEYDPFYIKKGEQFTVLGRIIPRVRL